MDAGQRGAQPDPDDPLLGREEVLQALDGWIRGEGAADRGWVLVTGGPGLGKSAIVSHYLASRLREGWWTVSYSLDRRDADGNLPYFVQRALAIRIEDMLRHQGDMSGSNRERLPTLLKRLSEQVLQKDGSRLLIVLDDVDAAGGQESSPLWQFVPDELPYGVWFLCSCRQATPDEAELRRRAGERCIDLSDRRWADSNERAIRAFWEHHASSLTRSLSEDSIAELIRSAAGNIATAVSHCRRLASLPPKDPPEAIFTNLPTGGTREMVSRRGGFYYVDTEGGQRSLESMREQLAQKRRELRAFLGRPPQGAAEMTPDEQRQVQRAVREESHRWRGDPLKMAPLVAQRLRAHGWQGLLDRLGLASGEDAPPPPIQRSLAGHQRPVNACVFTPDARRVISASDDSTLRVWDPQAGAAVGTLGWHQREEIKACAITRLGQVISGTVTGTLRVWDLGSEKEARRMQRHQGIVLCCAVTPDGERAVSGDANGALIVWNLRTGRMIDAFRGSLTPVWDCAISPDGSQVFFGADDGTISHFPVALSGADEDEIWALAGQRPAQVMARRSFPAIVCTCAANGKLVVSGEEQTDLEIWDLSTPEGVAAPVLIFQQEPISSCALSPEGHLLITGSIKGVLRVWDLRRTACINEIVGHTTPVSTCAISPDGLWAASTGAGDPAIRVWDLGLGQQLACAVGPDGTQVLSGWDGSELMLWDLRTGKGRELDPRKRHAARVVDCTILADGLHAVSRGGDGEHRVWDLRRGACLDAGKDFIFVPVTADPPAPDAGDAPAPDAADHGAGDAAGPPSADATLPDPMPAVQAGAPDRSTPPVPAARSAGRDAAR